ncbi:MAG: 50S ribosomal protein L29 [Candidatus Aminicenantes bacterium RBG_13_62_12]|nr:MAG: 50S ribosomal protein L29 [Candidatus Aminicenantes bacterium RBG_13_62_12]
MKTSDLRELSAEELGAKKNELKDQLFKLRFQNAQSQLENAASLKNVRRDIARIETVLKEMEKETE